MSSVLFNAVKSKVCPKCKKDKPLTDYYKKKNIKRGHKDGLEYWCKKCYCSYNSQWRKNWSQNKTPEERKQYNRKYNKKSLRGMTTEEYDKKLSDQGGVCEICRKPERVLDKKTGIVRNLAVDHCHYTDRVRGLLCQACNISLGGFEDNKMNLMSAIEYLKRYSNE